MKKRVLLISLILLFTVSLTSCFATFRSVLDRASEEEIAARSEDEIPESSENSEYDEILTDITTDESTGFEESTDPEESTDSGRKDTSKPAESSSKIPDDISDESETTGVITDEVSGDTPEETTTDPKDPDITNGFGIGSTNNRVYINEYFEIKTVIPENWRYYTAKELEGLYETSTEILDISDAKNIADSNGYYDMMAVGPKGASVNVVISNCKLYGGVSLIDCMEPTNELIKQTYGKMGFTVTADYFESGFCGHNGVINKCVASTGYASIYIKQAAFIKNDYLCVITASALDVSTVDQILSAFAKP